MYFLIYRVEKSRYFKRDGADVHTEASISLSQAILGGTIRIQGVYEDQTIQVSVKQLSKHSRFLCKFLNNFNLWIHFNLVNMSC